MVFQSSKMLLRVHRFFMAANQVRIVFGAWFFATYHTSIAVMICLASLMLIR